MTSPVPRSRVRHISVEVPGEYISSEEGKSLPTVSMSIGDVTDTLWQSSGNPINRKTGKYEGGGAFHCVHSGVFVKPLNAFKINRVKSGIDRFYTGPVWGSFEPSALIGPKYSGSNKDQDVSILDPYGTTAIAQCAPTNPTANLATTLAETMREGIPSLPGIQSWRKRAERAKAAGSEYLNYQFGWAPLVSEVHTVVGAARNHRDIVQNYRHNEGRNVHRRFDFPSVIENSVEEVSSAYALNGLNVGTGYITGVPSSPLRTVSVNKETKRWFEGCFTYGGPGGTDYASKSLGFGSDADAVFGVALSPDILWELTPWSWAVDWFTNAGDMIHNVTSFALAGLVMRYGYMMEETIETYSTNYSDCFYRVKPTPSSYGSRNFGDCSIGYKTIRKTRAPANPFGFGVGWEGLSPTQLAITAAIGITRLL